MKVIDHALEVLPPCPGRLADAVKTATDTIVAEGQGFAQDVSVCADTLLTDLQAVAAKMQEIPSLLDPQAIIDCCQGVLEKAAADLRQLADAAAAIPQRLIEQASEAEKLVDSAKAAIEEVSSLPQELAALKPDISAQLAFFEGLPARGQALAALAQQSAAMVDQYGRELLPLSAELKSLALLERGAASAATEAVLLKAEQLQGISLAQVQALRDQLDGNVSDLEQAMQDAVDLANQTIDGVSSLLADKSAALLQPLQDQIDFIADCRTVLAEETTKAEALFDEGCAQLLRLSDILMEPLATARAQVDAVIGKVGEAGAMVDSMAQKALTPIDALDTRVDNVAAALAEVIAAIENEVAQVVQLMRELDQEAEQVKPVLRALPDHFEPVRTSIAAAITLLVQVKDNIPPFVNEAKSALRTADSELNQADDLCIHAIEICTLYQMKAPPLMLARTLFVGIKAMIPPLHATIASAITAVQAVGDQATALMDSAIGVVEALNPLLDQAVALVQRAIDALLLLLQKMQDGLALVIQAAESVPPVMRQAIDKAVATAHEVLAKVRKAAEDCLAQLQCEALVQRLQQQLSDLLDRTLAPLEAQLDAATGPLRSVLEQGKVKVGQASALAQDGLQTLAGAIGSAQQQAGVPVQALQDALRSAQQQLSSAGTQAQQAGRAAADHALSYLDRAMQAISDLNVREMAGPAMAYVAYADQFADRYQSAREQVTQAGSLDAVVDNWRAQAGQQLDSALAQARDSALQAAQSVLGIQLAGEEAADGAAAQRDTLVEDGAVGAEVQASFEQMQADAQGVADQSGASLDQMSGSLEEARTQSDSVGVVDPELAAAELADVQSQADQAAAAAEEAKAAEQDVAGEIVKAQEQVAAAAKDAEVQATAMKDEAQAEIQKAQAHVESVQASVNAARADAIKAEAIVDAEVVKHGGASSQQDAATEAAEAAAAGAAEGAAAGAGAGAAGAGTAGAAGAGAEAGAAGGAGAGGGVAGSGAGAQAGGAADGRASGDAGNNDAAATGAGDTTAEGAEADADAAANASRGTDASASAGAEAGASVEAGAAADGSAASETAQGGALPEAVGGSGATPDIAAGGAADVDADDAVPTLDVQRKTADAASIADETATGTADAEGADALADGVAAAASGKPKFDLPAADAIPDIVPADAIDAAKKTGAKLPEDLPDPKSLAEEAKLPKELPDLKSLSEQAKPPKDLPDLKSITEDAGGKLPNLKASPKDANAIDLKAAKPPPEPSDLAKLMDKLKDAGDTGKPPAP